MTISKLPDSVLWLGSWDLITRCHQWHLGLRSHAMNTLRSSNGGKRVIPLPHPRPLIGAWQYQGAAAASANGVVQ